MKRWCASLLAFLLVPVLIVSAPGVASAATVYGTPATGSPSFTGGMTGQGVNCSVTGYWVVPETGNPSITIKGDCTRGWISPWEDLTLYASAPGCSMASDYEHDSEQDGFTMTMTPVSLVAFDAASCNITTGEAHFIDPDCVSNDASDDVCWQTDQFAWALGAPPAQPVAPPSSSACEHLNVSSVKVAVIPYASNNTYAAIQTTIKGVRKTMDAGIVVTAYIVGPANRVEIVNTTQWWPGAPATFDGTVVPQSDGFKTPGELAAAITMANWTSQGWRVAGVEFISAPYAFNGLGQSAQRALPHKMEWPTGRPGQHAWATNDPTNCRWYVGDLTPGVIHVADPSPSGTSSITPWGPYQTTDGPTPPAEPVVTQPVPDAQDDADKCTGFSFRDPATWAGAGMCMVVSALANIWDRLGAVVRAVGRIAQQVLDGLGLLFIPKPSSWGWSGLVDQAKARPPFSVVAGAGQGVQSISDAYQAGGGCGSLADFTSEDIQANLTCSQVKDAAGLGTLYGIVQIALWSLTGLGIFKMIAGAVGSQS